MKLQILTFIFILFSSCQIESNYNSFTSHNPIKLELELQDFIHQVNTGNHLVKNSYRNKSIKWWNNNSIWSDKKEGKPSIILPTIYLSQIKELNNLSILDPKVNNDTITGLINTQKIEYPMECYTEYGKCDIDTNYISLVLKDGKISEIINNDSQNGKRSYYFCIDQSEIGSNEYKMFKNEELGGNSREEYNYNDFTIEED